MTLRPSTSGLSIKIIKICNITGSDVVFEVQYPGTAGTRRMESTPI